MQGMLQLGGSIHKAKPSANGPTWWHVPRWRKQERQSTQRRWLVMCLALPSLTGQHVTRASLHVTGAFLHATGAFLHVTGAALYVTGIFLHVCGAALWGTGAFLRVSWAFLHVSRAFLHAFLIGLAVHDSSHSVSLSVCMSPSLPVHWLTSIIAISSISASRKTDDTSMRLSTCLPVCLSVYLSVCLFMSWIDWSHLALPSVV